MKEKEKIVNELNCILKELEAIHLKGDIEKKFNKYKTKLKNLCEETSELIFELNKSLKEREDLEKKLQEQYKMFESVIKKLNVAIFIFDVVNGKFVFEYLNPAHEMLTGFKTEEVRGKTPYEFLPQDIALQVESNYRRCVEEKKTIEYEEKLILKGKETFWFTRLIPLINENGEVFKIIGTSININEWKAAINELNEKNLLLEKIFEVLPIPVFYIDSKKGLLKINGAFQKVFNIPKSFVLLDLKKVFPEKIVKILEEKEIENSDVPLEFEIKFTPEDEPEEKHLFFRISKIKEKDLTVCSVLDITTQKKYENFLEKLALKDELTDLYNRRGLKEFVDREWKNAIRNKQPISILMIDIDNFKSYNDTYGHKMGDICLKNVSETIRKNSLRPMDIVARYGGEEFIVILPNTPFEGALTVAERIRNAIEKLNIQHIKSPFGKITVSIGVSTSVPEKLENFEALLEEADKNMYTAKKKGKNRVEGYKIIFN